MVEKFFEAVRRDHAELWDKNRLGLAAGLIVGEVTKGSFGSLERRAFDVFGQGVEKARLMACAASTGNILVDEATFRAVVKEDSDQGVKVEVVWRGSPLEAYRIKPKLQEVFTGSLAQPLVPG